MKKAWPKCIILTLSLLPHKYVSFLFHTYIVSTLLGVLFHCLKWFAQRYIPRAQKLPYLGIYLHHLYHCPQLCFLFYFVLFSLDSKALSFSHVNCVFNLSRKIYACDSTPHSNTLTSIQLFFLGHCLSSQNACCISIFEAHSISLSCCITECSLIEWIMYNWMLPHWINHMLLLPNVK